MLNTRTLLLPLALAWGAALSASAGPLDGGFLRAQGKQVVDEKGRPVRLEGFGLGNWMLPEGYMWKFGPQGDRPRKIEAVIEKCLGPEEARAFWKKFRDNYVTEKDIARIAELGFNCVRPALKARDFLTEDAEPRFVEEGFQRLDALLAWCRKHNVYAVLDLHAAPGGQTGKNIDDSARDFPELFSQPRYQDQTERLWVALARRYAAEPAVAGYDLLNEPLPGDFAQFRPKLEPLYKRLTAAIRKVDARHMILLEGADWANNWSVFGPPFDANLCYQFHKYWNDPDRASVQGYIDFQERHQVPVWVGEFGESKVGPHWYAAATQLFDDLGWGWAFWPWKKLDASSTPCSIPLPKGWEKIQAVSDGGAPPPRAEARAILGAFVESVRLENCRFNADVIDLLKRRVPGRIQACDFGHLGEGRSFHSAKPRRRGLVYRRSEPMLVKPAGGEQAFNVGWTEPGEWLKYDLEVEREGVYEIGFRAAAEAGGKSLRLELDGADLSGEVAVGATGGWNSWQTFSRAGLSLPKGRHSFTVFFTTGGTNLHYWYARLEGQPLPERPEQGRLRRGKLGRLPGRIEAVDFGPLGEGRSYHDREAANQGGALRAGEGVDIQALEGGAPPVVGLEPGEWLSYEVNSLREQDLKLTLRLRSPAGGSLAAELDGRPLGQARGAAAWAEAPAGGLRLAPGRHSLRLACRGAALDLDWAELKP